MSSERIPSERHARLVSATVKVGEAIFSTVLCKMEGERTGESAIAAEEAMEPAEKLHTESPQSTVASLLDHNVLNVDKTRDEFWGVGKYRSRIDAFVRWFFSMMSAYQLMCMDMRMNHPHCGVYFLCADLVEYSCSGARIVDIALKSVV